jgi:uncharacterized protein YegL
MTNIKSRLEETIIMMTFHNSLNCSKAFTTSLQLPVYSRVTDLSLSLSDGCELTSQVKDFKSAIEDFDEQLSQGRPAALLTAWDMMSYQLKVSIPPLGSTIVELVYQEVHWKKMHQIPFQVPLFPGLAVEHLVVDLSVEDVNSGITKFHLDDFDDQYFDSVSYNDERNIGTVRYEDFDVPEDALLPRLLKAYYDTGPLPEEGLLIAEGGCATHLFNPSSFLSSAGSMARNIVFVIDISGSMSLENKLQQAKDAFVEIIQTLRENDVLRIHTFSNDGAEDSWGPQVATESDKIPAVRFVDALRSNGGTNLNDAYLEALSYLVDFPNNYIYPEADTLVSILVILTDGEPTLGETHWPSIARNIRLANYGGRVKIFSLAFGKDSAIDLLTGVSIQNGGVARQIHEGFGDAASQIKRVYLEELGSVLLSDINVRFESDDSQLQLLDSTRLKLPVLADGSEIMIRSHFQQSSESLARRNKGRSQQATLRVITSALSALGPQSWSTETTMEPSVIPTRPSTECHLSYVHARIVELLELRDAESSLGTEFDVEDRIPFEDLARDLAIEAGLVWPGLTGMVSIESPFCEQNTSVKCYDGEGDQGEPSPDAGTDDPPTSPGVPMPTNNEPVSAPTSNDPLDSNGDVYTSGDAARWTVSLSLFLTAFVFLVTWI